MPFDVHASTRISPQSGEAWSLAKAEELYEVPHWSNGYFTVAPNGHLRVHPSRSPDQAIDLKELVDNLQMRGIDLPILIRFGDIVKHRLAEIHDAFATAIREQEYRGEYRCVYPIKVNQQRQVVDEVLEFGRAFGYGLEAGSKPELLAVVAMANGDVPIICNGFKDAEFIEIATWAQKIGRNVLPVVERFPELELILKYAERIGVRPQFGMRVKLASPGSGKWQSSGGYRSKFGLTVSEMLQAHSLLKELGLEDCFRLLHFHLGSQVTNIRHLKGALNEAARVYVELIKLGAGLKYLDVGGGLGVDYDGSRTDFDSSMNYTLGEYARDVVYHIQSVCDEENVDHPTILSESGRAIVAYHAVLVFNVLGVAHLGQSEGGAPLIAEGDVEKPIADLKETLDALSLRNLLESYHDAQQALEMAISLFTGGYLPLSQRAEAENLYWAICRKIKRLSHRLKEQPEEFEGLDSMLSATYFCNFSLFQSMPDSWAIDHLFPIMPIHRLDEPPTLHAVLADITCDSDGKVDRFIDRRDVKRTLPLHPLNGEPYYLAAFLVGAYQEILGDMHNLFGDTNSVHVRLGESGQVLLDDVVKGDTVREVLDYVEFNPDSLLARFRSSVEAGVRDGRIDYREAGRLLRVYEEGLNGYTYLEDERGD